jgi:hypothetical protein
MGIEPTSPAWEAGVIAIIRRPQSTLFYRVFGGLGSGLDWMLAWLYGEAVALLAVRTSECGPGRDISIAPLDDRTSANCGRSFPRLFAPNRAPRRRTNMLPYCDQRSRAESRVLAPFASGESARR